MELQIHQLLRKKRKDLGVTQEDVARKVFVSNRTISNWETGKTFPDIDSLIRLANYYCFSLDEFLLEGAPIVKDIKNKAELKTIKRMSIPPLITNLCLIFMLISQRWFGSFSEFVLLLISVCILSNFFPLYYFKNKSHKMTDYKLNKLNNLNLIIKIVYIVSIVLIATALILLIPVFMNKQK